MTVKVVQNFEVELLKLKESHRSKLEIFNNQNALTDLYIYFRKLLVGTFQNLNREKFLIGWYMKYHLTTRRNNL